MSNFNCPHCGKPCIDSPLGYVTGCVHYPADVGRLLEASAKFEAEQNLSDQEIEILRGPRNLPRFEVKRLTDAAAEERGE